MDRGYPSTPAFIHMMDKGIKFIVRLKSSDYKKEQSSLLENDQLVKIKLDKSRIRHYEGDDRWRTYERTGRNFITYDKNPIRK